MMRCVLRYPCFAASAVAIGCAAPQARAFDRFWNSFASGNFIDTTKWIGGAVPGAGDAAIFRVFGGTPGPYVVTFPGHQIFQGPANYLNDTLRIGPNTVTFVQSVAPNLTSSTYTLSSAIQIGEGTGPSVLNSSLSLLTSPAVSIGYLAGNTAALNINGGAFNVTGSGSTYELAVGDNAPGTLSVNAGVQMNVNGAEGNAVLGASAGVSGTINITGAGAIWNNTSSSAAAPLVVGDFGSGALNITGGGQVSNASCYIANQLGSIGGVAVSGAGSTWINRNALIVGLSGAGTLAISSAGQVTCDSANIGANAGANGLVQISGAGSLWSQNADLNIGGIVSFNGSSGAGVMIRSSGGNVTTGGSGYVGSSGSGNVSVGGIGSKWTVTGLLNVADKGVLTIADRGAVASNTAFAQGVVNVNGGANWNISDFLQVSESAVFATNTGTVNVSSGGQVNSRVAFVAAGGFGGLGQVNLDGAGSTWNTADQLYVGFLGRGTFNITASGAVTSGECQLGVGNGSTGTVVVDGTRSIWTTAQNMDVGVAGTGNLTVSHGGAVSVNGLLSIGLRGTLQGNSAIQANVRNGGAVAPGISPSLLQTDAFATLQITGNYTQIPAGRLQIGLHTTTEHDRLLISGDAALAGTLELDQAIGFAPNPGDRFTVLTAAHRAGVFDSTASLGGSSIRLVPIYTPTDVVIYIALSSEKTWGVDAGGNSSLPANWIGGAPGAVGDKVAFSTVITADRTVTVDSSFTAGSIYFDGNKNYLVQGPGGITLDVASGNASLAVKNLHGGGTHTIAAPVTLNDSTNIDVSASSTLRMTQPMNAAAGVAIAKTGAGTLAVKNVRADGLSVNGGTVQLLPGGGAGGTSVVKSLAIGAAARLDLNNNDMLLDYSGASPYTTIRDYLLSGLNTGVGGIVSTSGQAAGNTVHAIVDNAHLHLTAWNGLPIDNTTIIAKYTLRGDANLDGAVGFADLVAVAQHYGDSSGNATWSIGDFNYDGNVGFADLVAIAQNYGAILPSAPISGASLGFEADVAVAMAEAPEPGAGFLLLGAAGMLSFRRRARR